jgi:hypothetical protein
MSCYDYSINIIRGKSLDFFLHPRIFTDLNFFLHPRIFTDLTPAMGTVDLCRFTLHWFGENFPPDFFQNLITLSTFDSVDPYFLPAFRKWFRCRAFHNIPVDLLRKFDTSTNQIQNRIRNCLVSAHFDFFHILMEISQENFLFKEKLNVHGPRHDRASPLTGTFKSEANQFLLCNNMVINPRSRLIFKFSKFGQCCRCYSYMGRLGISNGHNLGTIGIG